MLIKKEFIDFFMVIQVDIKLTRIKSAIFSGSFDNAFDELKNNGYEIISLAQNARLRIRQGKEDLISESGNWVKEGALYVQGKGRFITKNPPVLEDPKKATQAHRNGKEFFISDAQVQRALENSVYVPYSVDKISTESFDENPITRFCFGENAEKYGIFLKEAGIKAMPLWFNSERDIKKQGKHYANQLWLSVLNDLSGFYGNNKHLDFLRGLRGIKNLKDQATN